MDSLSRLCLEIRAANYPAEYAIPYWRFVKVKRQLELACSSRILTEAHPGPNWRERIDALIAEHKITKETFVLGGVLIKRMPQRVAA